VIHSLWQQWRRIPSIFTCFLKIGPVTFGGGYAMIPLIEREVVEKRKWLKTEEVTDVFALSQSIPGAVAINSATFIGYRLAGVPGAIAAMCGILLPTFLIVMLLSVFFINIKDYPKVEAAFTGIRAAIVALICYAGVKVGKTAVLDKTTLAVLLGTMAVLALTSLHPVFVIIGGFALGSLLLAVRAKFGLNTYEKQEPEEDWGYMMGDGI
jgi:chromate transporter